SQAARSGFPGDSVAAWDRGRFSYGSELPCHPPAVAPPNSASESDVAEVDASISIVVLVVVIHVVNGDMEQPRAQHGESEVELCGSVRKRFGESRACAGHNGLGSRFSRVAEAESRVLEGFQVASADHPIGAPRLE